MHHAEGIFAERLGGTLGEEDVDGLFSFAGFEGGWGGGRSAVLVQVVVVINIVDVDVIVIDVIVVGMNILMMSVGVQMIVGMGGVIVEFIFFINATVIKNVLKRVVLFVGSIVRVGGFDGRLLIRSVVIAIKAIG